jgi:predicted transcriptional regulator
LKLRFHPSGSGVEQVLGELESRVMRLVWENPGATAREIYRGLDRPDLAYTTIVTILDRLHAKRLVTREKRGRPYLYTAKVGREDFEARLTRDVLAGLLKDESRPVLNTFVDLLSASPESLDELERLIRERKR